MLENVCICKNFFMLKLLRHFILEFNIFIEYSIIFQLLNTLYFFITKLNIFHGLYLLWCFYKYNFILVFKLLCLCTLNSRKQSKSISSFVLSGVLPTLTSKLQSIFDVNVLESKFIIFISQKLQSYMLK